MGFVLRRRLPLAVFPLLLLSITDVGAFCLDLPGYPIHQGAFNAYFAPLPVPVDFDPNGVPRNISAAFWQIGFGNRTFSTHPGVGNPPGAFPGNDSGYFPIYLQQARRLLPDPSIPVDSVCLTTNNWANGRVDGCCDDLRDSAIPYARDGLLNPFMDVSLGINGSPGYYSLYWQQDYPMAVLLKAPATSVPCEHSPSCGTVAGSFCNGGPRDGQACQSEFDCDFCTTGPHAGEKCVVDMTCEDLTAARYFAIAAVASWDRDNDGSGDNGPCAATNPGSNPGPCNNVKGDFRFSDVSNGALNQLTGEFNVIPWQEAPVPQLTCSAGCSSGGPKTIDASWSPTVLYHDGSIRPTTNPTLAPADPTRAAGVGVLDVAAKFPLVRYQLESAPVTCANVDSFGTLQPATMTWTSFGSETAGTSLPGFTSAPDTCYRVRVLFGKKPEMISVPLSVCALGKCGDIGYDASRLDPGAIDCVGGSVVQGSTGTATTCGCTPTTCAAQGKDCGVISDGCGGTLDCGSCSAPLSCGGGGVPNVCGCIPTTCATQGKNCGVISDACGGTLDCGGCIAPQSCGGGGVPNVCGGGPPPAISVGLTPSVLWPPNHQMIAVHADVTASVSVGPAIVTLVSVTSSESDDAPGNTDGHTVNDIQGASVGTADFDFFLRAERDSMGSGRSYTATYRVVGGDGRSATGSAVAIVPRIQGGSADPILISISQGPSGTLISWNAAPGAQHYNVIRGQRERIHEIAESIDLGSVTCVAGGIEATSTAGFEDASVPAPGQAFFYLTEYFDGVPSTYGAPDASKPRAPASGGCP